MLGVPSHALVTNWDKQVANTQSPLLTAFVSAVSLLQSDIYFQNRVLWAEFKNSMAMRNILWSITVRQANVLCNCDFGVWDLGCLSAFSAGCFNRDPKLLAKSGPSENTAGMTYEATGPPVHFCHGGNNMGSYFHWWWDTITALGNVSIVFHCKDKRMHQVILCFKRLAECQCLGCETGHPPGRLTAVLEWEEDHLLSWYFPCCLDVNLL